MDTKIIICPKCGGKLRFGGKDIKCKGCQQIYKIEFGVPMLYFPHKEINSKGNITQIVKSFYEENPFPNYDDIDSKWSLIEKAERGIFAKLLNLELPKGTRLLEVGCGTGQLGNYLGIAKGRDIYSVDICFNSLKLARSFNLKNKIDNTNFLQMNLFKPVFLPGTFDVVICSGVLHHTDNPKLGFSIISRLVKKNGYVIVGLYNAYGRVVNDVRSLIYKVTGDKFKFLDPRLRDKKIGRKKKDIWFVDQYKHPHEHRHTIDEVLKWFGEAGFEYINGIPKIRPLDQFSEKEKLFSKNLVGNKFEHLLTQLGMVLDGGKEGGFFLIIGRRR